MKLVRERSKSLKKRKMLDNCFVSNMNRLEKKICLIKSVGKLRENILYCHRCRETSIITLTEAPISSKWSPRCTKLWTQTTMPVIAMIQTRGRQAVSMPTVCDPLTSQMRFKESPSFKKVLKTCMSRISNRTRSAWPLSITPLVQRISEAMKRLLEIKKLHHLRRISR